MLGWLQGLLLGRAAGEQMRLRVLWLARVVAWGGGLGRACRSRAAPRAPLTPPLPTPTPLNNPPQGSARVIRCLQENRAVLSQQCTAALFDHEVRFSSLLRLLRSPGA